MRIVDWMQVFGALVGGFATTAMALEKRLIGRLRKEEAVSPENAVTLPDLSRISRWRLSRLLGHGAVRKTGTELFYLDEQACRKLRKRRLSIAIPVVLAAVALVLLLH